MTRAEAYEALFQLKHDKNIDISEQLDLLLNHKVVSKSIEKFIKKHSNRTLDDFLLVIAKTKTFFQNICYNYQDNISDYVRAFLSLLTHLRITLDKNPELRQEICNTFDIDKIANACIYNIKVGGNDAEIIEIAHELKDIFLKDN